MALLVIAVCLFSVLVTFYVVFQSVDLYFPADGAHYVGDADALLGRGVRDLRHPPLFPLLLGFFQLFVGDVAAFQLSFGTDLFLLPLGLYVLLRRWFGQVSSLVGTVSGALSPAIGEVVGWGGAATLLALDMMLFTLASFEWWIQRGGRRGLIAGTFAGLTALTHPFVFAALVFFLGVRWAVLYFVDRPARREWDLFEWKGILSFALPLAAGFGVASNYYARLKTP
ncbi:MAG: hypothetical protein WDA27_15035, partial [Actinomycetota bacterium]